MIRVDVTKPVMATDTQPVTVPSDRKKPDGSPDTDSLTIRAALWQALIQPSERAQRSGQALVAACQQARLADRVMREDVVELDPITDVTIVVGAVQEYWTRQSNLVVLRLCDALGQDPKPDAD